MHEEFEKLKPVRAGTMNMNLSDDKAFGMFGPPKRMSSLSVLLQDNRELLAVGEEEGSPQAAHDRRRAVREESPGTPQYDSGRESPQQRLTGHPSLVDPFMMRNQKRIHMHSADLQDTFSPVQKERQRWKPSLPTALKSLHDVSFTEEELTELPQQDTEALKADFPVTFGQPYVELTHGHAGGHKDRRPLRVGLVLSGGPAPGGHNVIAGVYDFIHKWHPDSQFFGFMGGVDGIFASKYKHVMAGEMDRFRNQGGFDMLWSGRGKVRNDEDKARAVEVCRRLDLHGLIVVGGDGSNSNAALLAEHFGSALPQCAVIGVPKTIDGDLKNAVVETSFGFDTAAKVYSELIGNLCTDLSTAQHYYHFVRVMGRSASHLVLECAMQTRPNMVFIGEEVEAKNIGLSEIVDSVIDLIVRRAAMGKHYGIVLVPEGLIEFIPEMKVLIGDLNRVLKEGDFDRKRLSPQAAKVWDFLPESIQEQLLLDREASGYIQVAKIATERLLILLVQQELERRNIMPDFTVMPHYFGYEGRCAMPSNFDANYCYALGQTAGALIMNNKNGYMSVVRDLYKHPREWRPAGCPLTRMMKVISDGKSTFPGVERRLVELDSPLFKVLDQVRDVWATEDVYRSPGPIQFEGPVADLANYAVAVPTKEELTYPSCDNRACKKAAFHKSLDWLSSLQRWRVTIRPTIPALCSDMKARARQTDQYIPKDPYTLKQTLVHYPHLSNRHQFYIQEMQHDKYTPPISPGLRIGVVFMSRQAPGVMNILWGIHERLRLVQGTCIGFYGLNGLLDCKFCELEEDDLAPYVNMGGMEILGRSLSHSLMHTECQEKARKTCATLYLDGLVLVGSAFAISEAAMLTEYFLLKGCGTSVIGIPATGSNNVKHELIECCIGFDSTSKVYASLVGNILTDAASMPKYWHFVRIMGRDPSTEVLECALQTHPNVVIIGEEYGAADKTLVHIVQDIADVVVKRAEMGKNFGTVLIPEGLLSHLPNMRNLVAELNLVLKDMSDSGQLRQFQTKMVHLEELDASELSTITDKIAPWSLALFKSFPKFIRREFLQLDMGEMRFTHIETEQLLRQMVQQELEKRRSYGRYSGKFQAVTHFFGYQGRSSMPSEFDAQLGFTHGHLAAMCVESGLTGYLTTVRGLCGPASTWKMGAVPFPCLLKVLPRSGDEVNVVLENVPLVPSAEVDLEGKAFRWMKNSISGWEMEDRFCNPGPIQFSGRAASFYNRILHEEQAEYLEMLRHVEAYTQVLHDTCRFGVDENFLKTAYVTLNSLLTLRFHPDDVLSYGIPVSQHLSDHHRHEALSNQQVLMGALRAAKSDRAHLVGDNDREESRELYDERKFLPANGKRPHGGQTAIGLSPANTRGIR
ncbi:unnamed protein product [Vitrella brassicaformis CCMP3155]|uniref:Probable ATP-dependent 6-phosphofructokinase n=3 Tax=Vitrella brassicaformis TaxID=1169539 RepID=A0A0G4EFI5_VITBC|nr:unnamed protein product [Vitrella brassicaformis CCMP3155]|eukprot:CEL94756.1 unnamed protein product [Vitrella brassicaformis CCMP3155]